MKKYLNLKNIMMFFAIAITSFFVIGLINGVFDPVAGGATVAFNLAGITNIEGITSNDGEENMGGFGSTAYLGLRSHIASYPVLVAEPTTIEELVLLEGNYGLNTGKYFIEIQFAPESLSLTPESQGDNPGNNSFKLKGKGFIPNTSDKGRGYGRLLNNVYGIFIFINDDGTRMAIGDEKRPVKFKVTPMFGEKAADKRGIEVSFETDSFVPGYTYQGTIPLSDSETLPAVS